MLRKGLAALPHLPPRPKHTAPGLADPAGSWGKGPGWGSSPAPWTAPCPSGSRAGFSLLLSVHEASRLAPIPPPSTSRQCRPPWEEAALTSQVPDEGHGLDGVAAVGKGLDDVVLHDAQHAEAALVTCGWGQAVMVGPRELPGEPTHSLLAGREQSPPARPRPARLAAPRNPSVRETQPKECELPSLV